MICPSYAFWSEDGKPNDENRNAYQDMLVGSKEVIASGQKYHVKDDKWFVDQPELNVVVENEGGFHVPPGFVVAIWDSNLAFGEISTGWKIIHVEEEPDQPIIVEKK